MRLTPEIALRGAARTLHDRIAPALTDSFAGEAARLAEILVTLTAHGMDDMVAVRVDENARWRALFADAAALVQGDLADRLAAASRATEPGLRISQLDAETGRLRQLLMELQIVLETRGDDAARSMTQAIWRLLRQTEAERAPR